jgi:hypothetical protein
MGTEKLDTELDKGEIKQTRNKVNSIRLKDDAINKIRKERIVFGNKAFKDISFRVSKDTHQRGLLLRAYKRST